jgi:parvulin-like peptidyl-prolyl isomerase
MLDIINVSSSDVLHQAKLACLYPTLVEGIAARKIISRTAEAQKITAEVDEVQNAANNFRIANQLLSATETKAWLQKHNLSSDEFEEMIHLAVISAKLASQLFAEKVEPFFVEHQLDYSRVIIYEVILEDEDLAMELFYQLQESEISFYEAARQYIQDKELRRLGGYRGPLRRADLKPEIAAAVFGSTPPQFLKPIVTAEGSHIIFVEEILQPTLDESLRSRIISDLFSNWLQSQIELIKLDVLPEFKHL